MDAPRILRLVAALVLAVQADLPAQQRPPVAPGDRVRVSAPGVGLERWESSVLALKPDTLELDGGGLLALPFTSLTKLEVHRGQKSKSGLGASLGFVTGAVIGGLLGSYWGQDGCGWMEIPCIKKPEATVLGALGFGLAGAGIGALIGSQVRVDRWEEVPLDRLQVTLVRQRPGEFTVGLRLRL